MEMRSLVNTHGTMKIADARPTGKPKGAIIVLQEAFGLTDHIIGLTDPFEQSHLNFFIGRPMKHFHTTTSNPSCR